MAPKSTSQAPRSGASRKDADRHTARREQLLELAAEVFAESGFSAGTTTEIAKRAGLTQPALYHYVGSKDQLLAEICRRMGAELQRALDDVLDQPDLTPAERLVAFIDGHARTVIRSAGAMGIRATEVRHLPTRVRNKIYAEEREYLHAVERLVRDARDDGALDRDINPWVAAQALLGMMNWTYIWYRTDGSISEDEAVTTMIRLIGDLIGAVGSTPRPGAT